MLLRHMDFATNRRRRDLFLASFVSLFFELTCIRWVPGYVREMAYYANFILLAAFLGLGLGMIVRDRRGTGPHGLFYAIGALGFAVFTFRYAQVLSPGAETFIWENFSQPKLFFVPASLTVLFFFFLTAAAFVPIGRLVARAFEGFQPITAYTINVGGSIAGVVLFAGLCYVGAPPAVWFAVVFACLIYLAPAARGLGGVIAVLILGLVIFLDRSSPGTTSWSPYYKISLVPHTVTPAGSGTGSPPVQLLVDDDFLQHAVSMRPSAYDSQLDRQYRDRYAFPYAFLRAKRVLVLGGGMGNDASMALERGAERVDVVEIDPLIRELGLEHHPDRPYADPRVVTHVDDARSFLEKADASWDLIIFGTLDSHRLFSHMGSVRMDGFVYTRESFASARRLLAPDGMLVMTFAGPREWIKTRLYSTVAEVFGSRPLAFDWSNDWLTLVVAKDGRQESAEIVGRYPVLSPRDARAGLLLTDDWPHLYIKERRIPRQYLAMLVAVFLMSTGLVVALSPRPWTFSGFFFAMGSGFLLLETRSVTALALLFGSTWVVNAVVFTAILAVILLANLLVSRVRLPGPSVFLALLVASLVFGYGFDLRRLLVLDRATMLVASSFVIALPIFFAALVFAKTFATTARPAAALGSNLLGAVFGGLAEYASLALGLRALYLLSIGVYLVAWLLLSRSRRSSVAVPDS